MPLWRPARRLPCGSIIARSTSTPSAPSATPNTSCAWRGVSRGREGAARLELRGRPAVLGRARRGGEPPWGLRRVLRRMWDEGWVAGAIIDWRERNQDGGRPVRASGARLPRAGGTPAGQGARRPRVPSRGAPPGRHRLRGPRVGPRTGERPLVPTRPRPLGRSGAAEAPGLPYLRPPQPRAPQLLRGMWRKAGAPDLELAGARQRVRRIESMNELTAGRWAAGVSASTSTSPPDGDETYAFSKK